MSLTDTMLLMINHNLFLGAKSGTIYILMGNTICTNVVVDLVIMTKPVLFKAVVVGEFVYFHSAS